MTTTTSACFLHNEMASTWQWRIDTDPELAASLGLLSKRRSKHALDPRSPASFEKRLEWIQRALWRMEEGLTPEQSSTLAEGDKLSYRLYMGQLRDYINYTTKHRAFLCCVNRLEGPQTDLPLYARYLPLKNKSHREFYKKFLEGVPVQLSEVMELLQIGLKERRTPPSVSLDGVIDMIRVMIAGKMISFSGPISGDEVFDLPEEMDLKVECMELVSKITEAFTKFADFLEKDYVHNLRTEISAAKGYPEGENYYRDCLTFHTTTDLSPTEIHQLGLDEVARISKEMNEIATHAGYEGRLEGYMEYLRTNSKYEPTSADALCAHYRDITGRIGPELLKIFHLKTLPRSPFSIVETPASQASMAPAAYYLSGSIDSVAPRPGVFYVNTSELKTRRTYECEALALHESIPGHHTQAAIQNESEGLPDFRRYAEDRRYFEAPCRFPFYTGYIEGWGLHSETLGTELGMYKHPEDKMGQLSMEALRSCRLVVDTGMHAFGWTLEEAFQYMLNHTAIGAHDALNEVKRYVTWPGQATAYKVGERVIHKLRVLAQEQLGVNFDPRDFYHIILSCGPVPLDVLEQLINLYISRKLSQVDGCASSNGAASEINEGQEAFLATMTFSNWCKCCVVPGTCL